MADADTSPGLLASTSITPVVVRQISASTTVTLDVYSNRPTPASAGAGSMFYASDQVAIYLSNGVAWLRIGPAMPGDIIWTAEATARSGYVLLTGQAWPSTTGIYTELFGLWGGSVLPDVQGRNFSAKGTHADMATLLGNEGVATVANRRQKHRTTDAKTVSAGSLALTDAGHSHQTPNFQTNANGGALVGYNADVTNVLSYIKIATDSSTTGITLGGSPSLGGSIGTNVSTDPLDAGAYIVLQPQAKL